MFFKLLLRFFQKHQLSGKPLLLALSGGVDSLALFYSLILYREKYPFILHIAHVDHGWREESRAEAEILKKLSSSFSCPFHLKKLDFKELQGNLEEACRQQRIKFFKEICDTFDLKGVMMGHQQDDQAETVLKRIFEGAYWAKIKGLSPVNEIEGLRILRPFLSVPKKDLLSYLMTLEKEPFIDQTNFDSKFLRARMRTELIPDLNRRFGKSIQSSLTLLASEIEQIDDYFSKRLDSFLTTEEEGPFGSYFDFFCHHSLDLVEIKYFLKKIAEKWSLKLSREQYLSASLALYSGKANTYVLCGEKKLYVDRKHLFLLKRKECRNGQWIFKSVETGTTCSSWKDAWKGRCYGMVPLQSNYRMCQVTDSLTNIQALKKWWSNHHIPSAITEIFPLITENHQIIHEFLTGKSFSLEKSEENKMKQLSLEYIIL